LQDQPGASAAEQGRRFLTGISSHPSSIPFIPASPHSVGNIVFEPEAVMKTLSRFIMPAVLAAGSLVLFASSLHAVPAFARQTGASCSACHFQHFPGLTAYGRAFKSSGYTLAGGQGLIEDKHLSLSSVLNASIVTKIRYIKTNGSSGVGTDVGEFQFPDEAAVWLGGRVSGNVGFVLEAQLADPDAPMFASFRLPIGFNVRGGRIAAIPFTTDGLGAPFGFELLNTGAVRNTRMLEEASAFSAAQYVVGGAAEGKAEGVAFVLMNERGFISVTPWTPNHGSVALDHPAWYFRAALTPRVGNFDLGLGIQRWTGSVQASGERTDAWGADFQLQGQVSHWPVGIYAGYARAPASIAAREVFFNPEPRVPGGVSTAPAAASILIAPAGNFFNSEVNAEQAISVTGEAGIIPRRLTAALAFRMGDNGKGKEYRDAAGLVGMTYLVAQNFQVQLSHTVFGGNAWSGVTGDQRTMVMIFAAF
jgi:hypothetical protein